MAAMAGAISGARLGMAGLPERMLQYLNDQGAWGAEALTELAKSCAMIASG